MFITHIQEATKAVSELATLLTINEQRLNKLIEELNAFNYKVKE